MLKLLRLKPPHGWNVVAWELAIVTVGVFVALAAQQWAENLSAGQRTRQALAGIRDELADHYSWSVEWRVIEPCLLAQIDALSDRVLKSGPILDPAPGYHENEQFVYVLRLPSKEYPRSAWDGATAEGIAARFDPQLRYELNAHYAQVEVLQSMTSQNNEDYQSLLVMSRPIPLDPSVRFLLLRHLQGLRGRVEFKDLLSGQMIDHIERAGMLPSKDATIKSVQRYGTYRFCQAQHLPLRPFAQAMAPVAN